MHAGLESEFRRPLGLRGPERSQGSVRNQSDALTYPRRSMTSTLLRALIALVPASMLLLGSTALFRRDRTPWTFLQVVGAGGLVVVGLTHMFEALRFFPLMHWGLEDSIGHYLDLTCAVLGVALFPSGYLLHALTSHRV